MDQNEFHLIHNMMRERFAKQKLGELSVFT